MAPLAPVIATTILCFFSMDIRETNLRKNKRQDDDPAFVTEWPGLFYFFLLRLDHFIMRGARSIGIINKSHHVTMRIDNGPGGVRGRNSKMVGVHYTIASCNIAYNRSEEHT